MNRRFLNMQGFSSTPVLMLVGIVGLSTVFFLIFTGRIALPISGSDSAARQTAGPVAPPLPAPGSGVPEGEKVKPVAAKPPAAVKKPSSAVIYAKPDQLLAAVTVDLRSGDLENAMKRGGKDFAVLPGTNFLKLLLTKAGYQIPAEGPVFHDAGAMSPVIRYRVRLEPGAPSAPVPAGPIWVDAQRDRTTGSWKLSGVVISPALLEQGLGELRRNGVVIAATDLSGPMDPLQHSHQFLAGVLGQDFRTARMLTDRTAVAQEKLAGLCIVFEEGNYQLAPERPVVVTAASRDAAIALVRVRSETMAAEAEIGLTLHPAEDGGWTIQGLDFSRLLESYVQQSGAGTVFYSPVVKSPQGGESLVVYFDFNSAELVPRAVAQLNIVAGLLATDKARKLRISGHADDLGSDDINFRLSAARAQVVRAHLHRLAVNPDQIETTGFGATAPLDPNRQSDGTDNPEGRSRNRRTEIYLDF